MTDTRRIITAAALCPALVLTACTQTADGTDPTGTHGTAQTAETTVIRKFFHLTFEW